MFGCQNLLGEAASRRQKMRLAFLIWVIMIQSGAHAGARDVCFENKNSFFDPIAKVTMTPGERASSMDKFAKELLNDGLNEGEGAGVFESIFNYGMNFSSFGLMFGQGASAFSRLDQTELQKSFQKELDRIKQIKNPMDRVKQVYDLAVRTQGFGDYETMGNRTAAKGKIILTLTPGNLINSAEENGTAGVCREFASLLQWSLLQVARHPDSTGMALGPNDFSSEFIAGRVPGGGHAWVRVHQPKHSKEGQIQGFNDFDLDTTWYSEFSPLYPRGTGVTSAERRVLRNEYYKIRECLLDLQMSMDREMIQNAQKAFKQELGGLK
jgi:hypothetical protein